MLRDEPFPAGRRTFDTEPGISEEVGSERNPGTVRLLNDQGRQVRQFFRSDTRSPLSRRSVLAEKTEEISRTKLSDGIKAVDHHRHLDRNRQAHRTHSRAALRQGENRSDADRRLQEGNLSTKIRRRQALADDGTYQLDSSNLKLQNFASAGRSTLEFHHRRRTRHRLGRAPDAVRAAAIAHFC